MPPPLHGRRSPGWSRRWVGRARPCQRRRRRPQHQVGRVLDRDEQRPRPAPDVDVGLFGEVVVDREALKGYQADNDVIMAHNSLRLAFETDVRPALAAARMRRGGAIDPIACYRAASYRALKAETRVFNPNLGGGIV